MFFEKKIQTYATDRNVMRYKVFFIKHVRVKVKTIIATVCIQLKIARGKITLKLFILG